MQFVMLSSSSLALFTNRKFRLSLNWENVYQSEYKEHEFKISCEEHTDWSN